MFRPVPIERRTAPLQVERGVSSALALAGAISFSFLISNIGNLVSKGNAVEVRRIRQNFDNGHSCIPQPPS